MASKTILISINSCWNIVNFRAGLIRALQNEGYRILALAPPDETVGRLTAMGVDFHAIEMDQKGTSPIRDLGLLARYRSSLKRLRPDLLLCYTAKPNIYGSLAAHALGIPVINNVSGLGTAFIRRNWLTKVVSGLYRTALKRSRIVFFQNGDDRDLFVSKGLVAAGQARLLPGSGIDLEHYAPGPPVRDGAPSFLLIARLLRDKGVGEFVEAARTLRREQSAARFRLLGPVGAANRTAFTDTEVAAWVEQGLVEYCGVADDVRPHIAAADCIVLPSYREGLPRTLLEGAAMARPLIATDVPGCRDVVEEGVNGLLCQPRDAGSLADAMRRFASLSVAERRQLGDAGRRIVETRFDERLVHRSYLEAAAVILAERR